MEDKLAKFGYRLRPRTPARAAEERPGEIEFDELGNAVYQWKSRHLVGDNEHAEQLREQALEHPGLAIVDDDPPAQAMVRTNPKGLRVGYNPYESGLLDKKTRRRKTDLRELSKWIETKRKLEQQKKKSDE